MEPLISEIIKNPHQLIIYCLLTIVLTTVLLFLSKKQPRVLRIIEATSPIVTVLTILFSFIYAFYPDNLNFWLVISSLSLMTGMLIPRHVLRVIKNKKLEHEHQLLMQAVHKILNEMEENE